MAKHQYRHIKTGDVYAVHDSCKIKIDDNWVEGIIYFNVNNTRELFVRTEQNFSDSFKEVFDD